MTERTETGGVRNSGGERTLFVAVRSTDRQTLISPSADTPDFFDFTIRPDALPLQDRAAGLMSARHGLVVTPDHQLTPPRGETGIVGWSTLLRHVVNYDKLQGLGHFTAHDLRDMRKDLLHWSVDHDAFEDAERRVFRIKAELFQQVITLMGGKSPASNGRRR